MELLNSFKGKNILVVGDYCIDKFYYGEPKGVSPEAPVVRNVGNKDTLKINPGMTGNIVANINALGANCYAVGIIGDEDDDASRILLKIFNKRGINTQGLIPRTYRTTPEFIRIVSGGARYPAQHSTRHDVENTNKINEPATQDMINFIHGLENKLDAIIVADYNEFGEGIITEDLLEEVRGVAMRKGIPLMGDSRIGFNNFKNFTCIKPNLSEAKQIYVGTDSLEDIARGLTQRLCLKSILITKDKEGMYLFTASGIKKDFPAYAKKVVDVTGAGDSAISAFTLALSSGFSYEDSAQLASYAAAIAVSKPGVDVVTLDELKQFALESEK
jgi:rfaE bifunctional protein kinase chain/domain